MGWVFVVVVTDFFTNVHYFLSFVLGRYSKPYESIKYPCLKELNILIRQRSLRNKQLEH